MDYLKFLKESDTPIGQGQKSTNSPVQYLDVLENISKPRLHVPKSIKGATDPPKQAPSQSLNYLEILERSDIPAITPRETINFPSPRNVVIRQPSKQEETDLRKYLDELSHEKRIHLIEQVQKIHPDRIQEYLQAFKQTEEDEEPPTAPNAVQEPDNKHLVDKNVQLEIKSIKEQMESLNKRYGTVGGGGGTNAMQFSQGGVMRGDLTVEGIINANSLAISTLSSQDLNVHTIHFDTTHNTGYQLSAGQLQWNTIWQTLNLGMGNDVVQQIGQELYSPLVKNNTGSTIINGTPVKYVSIDGDYATITPFQALSTESVANFAGIATQDIPDGETGLLVWFGNLNDIDTSFADYAGQTVYVSTSSAGQYQTTKPFSPFPAVAVGAVTVVDPVSGRMFIRPNYSPKAIDITYNNEGGSLVSTNVKDALDELDNTKVDTSSLLTNLTLYSTLSTFPSNTSLSAYYYMPSQTTDGAYSLTAVNVYFTDDGTETGTSLINSTDPDNPSLVFQQASAPGLVVGDPGVFSVTQIGILKRVSGTSTPYFRYEIYKRDSSGVETLLGTSGYTPGVTSSIGTQLQESALFNDGSFLITDRIVTKFYAYRSQTGTDPIICGIIGGTNPIRLNVPVPLTVATSVIASNVQVSTLNFNGVLSADDITVQKALDKIDNYTRYVTSKKYGDYTVTETDNTLVFTLTAGSAVTTLIPIGTKSNKEFVLKNKAVSTSNLTVSAVGVETIDNVNPQTVAPGNSMTIVDDGSEWIIV